MYLVWNGTRGASKGVGNAEVPWHPTEMHCVSVPGMPYRRAGQTATQTMCDCPDTAALPYSVNTERTAHFAENKEITRK